MSQTVLGAVNKAVSDTSGANAYNTKYNTYLKLFSGELFKAYESATVAKGTVQNRQQLLEHHTLYQSLV